MHCVTHWREQRGLDSYLPRQISQSDCEISSNCGKNVLIPLLVGKIAPLNQINVPLL